MIVVQKKYFTLIGLLLLFLLSCKKDSDGKSPLVIFNTPHENQTYAVYDYVTVNASVSDETKLTSLSVSLLDAQEVPVHVTIPVSVSANSMTLNLLYDLDNIHLESGTYYILITASDGTNDTHAYQKIGIISVPKVLSKVYVTSKTSASQTNLSVIDSAFTSIIPVHSFSGDHIGSSVSSYYQQAYMCGNYTGNFSGLELSNNNVKFSIAPFVSPNPYFTGFYTDDKINYVSRYDGNIKGYNYLGNITFGATAIAGYYSEHICFNNGCLISEQQDKTAATKMLTTYYSTNTIEKNCLLNQDVVAFCEKDYANVFVFGNAGGQGVIQLFDRVNNNLWSPYPFPLATGAILSALKINADTYLIGHSNGTIYRYNYSFNSLTTYLTGYTAIQLKYDDLNDELYVVEANKISSFSYTAASFHHSVISPETILGINLMYNR